MSDTAPPARTAKSSPVPNRGRRGAAIKFLGSLRGDGVLVSAAGETAVRLHLVATWREMSDESRLTYTWPDPGQPRAPLSPFPTEPPDPLVPLPHFGLLVLDVREVDHLELVGNPQHRWSYEEDEYGRWSATEINP